MPRSALRFAAAAFAVALLGPPKPAGGAEPPPPTDGEITKMVALYDGIAGDAGRAEEVCAAMATAQDDDSNRDESLAQIGRRAEAHPILGPLLRRQGLSGERFAVVSTHVAGALFGLAFADELDTTAKERGQEGGNRAKLLAENPTVRLVAARQAELTAALTKVQALCESDGDEAPEEEAEEPEG